MPKSGIQACFSSNWNAALAGSNRHQRYSVAAKVTSDVSSAMLRTSGTRSGWSPRPPASSTSSAPASGKKTMRESSMFN